MLQGEWRLAEELFAELEGEVAGQPATQAPSDSSSGCNPWGAQGSATEMLASYAHAFRGDGGAGSAASSEGGSLGAQPSHLGLGLSERTAIFNPLEPYGMLPSSLTEQVRPLRHVLTNQSPPVLKVALLLHGNVESLERPPHLLTRPASCRIMYRFWCNHLLVLNEAPHRLLRLRDSILYVHQNDHIIHLFPYYVTEYEIADLFCV